MLCGLAILPLIIFSVAAWFGSEKLLYPPVGKISTYQEKYLISPKKYKMDIQVNSLKTNETYLVASPIASTGVNGTVMMTHGRKCSMKFMLPIAEKFCVAGYRCIMIDLPGHGQNTHLPASYGVYEGERVNNMMQSISSELKISATESKFLFGYSMGGAVAINAASQSNQWDALITVSTFSNLEDTIKNRIDQTTPTFASLLLKATSLGTQLRANYTVSSVNPENWMKNVTTPTYIIHGEDDGLIQSDHAQRLYKACASQNKTIEIIENAKHLNALSKGGKKLYRKMTNFLSNSKSNRLIGYNPENDQKVKRS